MAVSWPTCLRASLTHSPSFCLFYRAQNLLAPIPSVATERFAAVGRVEQLRAGKMHRPHGFERLWRQGRVVQEDPCVRVFDPTRPVRNFSVSVSVQRQDAEWRMPLVTSLDGVDAELALVENSFGSNEPEIRNWDEDVVGAKEHCPVTSLDS